MTVEHGIAFLLIALTALLTVLLKKLTIAGGCVAWMIGCGVFVGAQYAGILMLGAFFFLGTAATSWKIGTKEKLGAAEKNKGKRNAGQVLANGGVAAVSGFLAWWYFQEKILFVLMMAASLASATADTLSSELGTLYGKRFYNILTFGKDRRGDNGVVSIEGTLLGIAGSMVIATIFSIAYGWNASFFWIIIAGTLGNLCDSFIGATLERKNYLNNDSVNFLNTLVAALAVWALAA